MSEDNNERMIGRYQRLTADLIELEAKPINTLSWLDYVNLEDSCREVLCCAYRIDHDINRFLSCSFKVPEYMLDGYHVAKKTSEDALHAYFRPSSYYRIFYGLAGRNFDGARRLAKLIIDTGIFVEHGSWADCDYFGNTLMYLLTSDPRMYDVYYGRYRDGKRHGKLGKAFVKIFEGIFSKDTKTAHEGLVNLVKAMMKGEWVDDHIGYLNTWAIGMANLCRLHGVWVEGDISVRPPKTGEKVATVYTQVPSELLIPQEEVIAVLTQWPELGQLPPKSPVAKY